MQKQLINRSLMAGVAVFAFAALAMPVLAQEKQTTTTPTAPQKNEKTSQPKTTPQQTPNQQREQTQTKTTQDKLIEKKAAVQTKLDERKLRACQKREKSITSTMTRQADRGAKQLDVFTKIADRTQAFYIEKGKVLDNYDALVAEVAAKKAAAQAAIEMTKSNSAIFKCDGTDPRGAASQFKVSRNDHSEALKAYKTAVKNLIVGVKSVQSTTVKNVEGAQ